MIQNRNIEIDGWGLFLWAARVYVDESGDVDWLSETTTHGDTVYEAMREVAETGRGPAEQIPSMGCSIKWKAA